MLRLRRVSLPLVLVPPRLRGRPSWLLHLAAAALVYALAIPHHIQASSYADLPPDAIVALDRAVDIARLEDFPLRGNPVGLAWFGVGEDYLLAPFLVGADSLASVLGRAALFHALLAPLGYLLCAAFSRPLLGLAWGALLASMPALVALSRIYPVNYRTTHFVLAALLCSVFLVRSGSAPGRRVLWTWAFLLWAALATTSHPLAVGALPAGLLVAVLWGQFRLPEPGQRGRFYRPAVVVLAAMTVGTSFLYLVTNLPAARDLLSSDPQDPTLSMGAAFRGSLAAARHLVGGTEPFPGGLPAMALVLGGIVPAALVPKTRPALVWVLAWVVVSLGAFSLASYSASPWHLTPLVLPLLAIGVVGWTAALEPTGESSRVRELASLVGAGALAVLAVVGTPSTPSSPETAPVYSFSKLSSRLLELADGEDFRYLGVQARCGMDWSADATALDLRLRSGRRASGAASNGLLLAAVEFVPSMASFELPGRIDSLKLPNGSFFAIYRPEDPESWIATFAGYCETIQREPTLIDVILEPGGPAAPRGLRSCVLEGPCPSYRERQP